MEGWRGDDIDVCLVSDAFLELYQKMSSFYKSICKVSHLTRVKVDAVFSGIFEALRKQSRETEDLSLSYTDRVEDVLVTLVHIRARKLIGSFLQLPLEVCCQS